MDFCTGKKLLASIVQKVDTNRYPVDSATVCSSNTYPPDGDLSDG